jgi:hypothetical protein
MSMEIRKRLPAINKNISEINPDTDVRVRLMGIVIDTKENSLILDDGSAQTEIIFEDNNDVLGIENGQKLRIVTRILPLMGGFECRGECIQQLNGFNLSLYKSALSIINHK